MTTKAMKKNVWQMLKSSPYLQRSFGIGQWSFIGPGSEKKWYSKEENSHKEFGSISRKRCCWNSLKVDVQFSVQQFHCPGVSSKGKDTENCPYIVMLINSTIETIFRIIVFANQLSLYGAVANMCEECEFLHVRSGQPDVVMGQSIVLSEIKADVPLENDEPSISEFF